MGQSGPNPKLPFTQMNVECVILAPMHLGSDFVLGGSYRFVY
jgi:hypothetical protein